MSIIVEEPTTHDSRFTKGYWTGYIQAKIQDNMDFTVDVPQSNTPLLIELLIDSGADIDMGQPVEKQFAVRWCRLAVRFPAGF